MDEISEFMSRAPFFSNSNKVEFEDARKIKRAKKKIESEKKDGIITNGEGVEIINNSSKYIDFEQIKKKKWQFSPEKEIDKWTTWDFFSYTQNLFIEKYNKDWNLNKGGCSIEIKKVFSALEEEFGKINNTLIKDFICFFFKKHIDSFIYKYNNFYFSYMKRKDILKSFHNQYNCKNDIKKTIDESKKESLEKEIEKSYLIGENTLLCKYGIIIATNWLIKNNIKKEEAISIILNNCKKNDKKNILEEIIRITEDYSPYPEDMEFKEVEQVIGQINKDIKINVSFEKNEKNKLDFLLKGN